MQLVCIFLYLWVCLISVDLLISFRVFDIFCINIKNHKNNRSLELESVFGGSALMRETLTKVGKLGLRLLEDLTALAAGGSVCADWNYNDLLLN